MKKNHSINKIKKFLFKDGYCKIDEFLPKKYCENLIKELIKEKIKLEKNRLHKDEASKKGQLIIRDLILRNPKMFLNLIDLKIITQVLDSIFNEEYILDNFMATNSINIKQEHNRIVHIDSHIPVTNPLHTLDLVVMVCLNDFNKFNGSTNVWPKSHLSGIRVQNKQISVNKKKFKTINAKKGSLVFFLGQTWHQIGTNLNKEDRWGILIHYKRWWIKPQTNFTKCGNKIFKMLNNKQKKILGFNSISPEFNFKTNTREVKTVRKISSVSKNYLKAITY
jgi:ectoine hydroxylase-related dioxygenase (phytanoyl-CoA dioxygenase family)